jgi:hypothetical protein
LVKRKIEKRLGTCKGVFIRIAAVQVLVFEALIETALRDSTVRHDAVGRKNL